MSKQITILLLIFFPILNFGQNFQLINSFQIDSFQRATLEHQGFDFVLLGNSGKGVSNQKLLANVDGTDIRNSNFQGALQSQFSNQEQILAKKEEKFGFINRKGKVIIPLEYDYLGQQLVEGKVLGKKGNQWFFIDMLHQKIPFPDTMEYQKMDIVNATTIVAMNNRREYFFLDLEGKRLFEDQFSYVKPNRFHDDLFNIAKGRMRGILSSTAGILFPLDRNNNPMIKEGFIMNEHRTRSDSHFWDLEGKPIDTKQKDIVKPLQEGGYIFREVKDNEKRYGLCDEKFEVVFPAEFRKYYILPHGYLHFFYPNDSSFVTNSLGEIILPKDRFKVKLLSPDDLIVERRKRVNRKVVVEKSWLDGKGKVILPPSFDETILPSPIHGKKQNGEIHSILGVQRKDTTGVAKFHLYDRNAQLLKRVDYDSVYYYTPSLLLVIKNKLQGLINNQGKLVLPIEYKSISPFYDQVKRGGAICSLLRLVTPDGRMGLADLQGNLVFLTAEKVDQIHWIQEKYLWVIKGNEYQVYERIR